MREVYLAADPVNAEIIKDFLCNHGIEAVVRGYYLWSGQGELPVGTGPSVCVMESSHFEHARELIRQLEQGRLQAGAWDCPGCCERLGGQFTACWHCGRERQDCTG